MIRMNSVQDTEYDLRKKMYEEIKTFNRTELEELYKLLRRNSEEISENRNGMFFDLLSIKSDIFPPNAVCPSTSA